MFMITTAIDINYKMNLSQYLVNNELKFVILINKLFVQSGNPQKYCYQNYKQLRAEPKYILRSILIRFGTNMLRLVPLLKDRTVLSWLRF